jgi:hypothetical protein
MHCALILGGLRQSQCPLSLKKALLEEEKSGQNLIILFNFGVAAQTATVLELEESPEVVVVVEVEEESG